MEQQTFREESFSLITVMSRHSLCYPIILLSHLPLDWGERSLFIFAKEKAPQTPGVGTCGRSINSQRQLEQEADTQLSYHEIPEEICIRNTGGDNENDQPWTIRVSGHLNMCTEHVTMNDSSTGLEQKRSDTLPFKVTCSVPP